MINIENNRSGCPVSTSLEIIGDSWTLLIIRDLFLERNTFKDFMNSPEKISSNVLTDRLKKLIKNDIISYFIEPQDKKIKKYYLTDAGISLFPMIYNLSMWSKNHLKMRFNGVATEWYEENQNKNSDDVIADSINGYKLFRSELLSQAQNHKMAI